MDSSDSVCFPRQDFNTYMYLLLILLVYFVYILYNYRSSERESLSVVDTTSTQLQAKVKELQDQLYTFKLAEQRCQTELVRAQLELSRGQSSSSLEKIYNPLLPPERRYEGISGRNTHGYQMIGYIYRTEGDDRYPLFGKYKYPGRTEKWEYYVMDESRNKLKIPFKSVNDNEISEGDTVNVPSLGNGFTAKIYEYEQLRYNPNLL